MGFKLGTGSMRRLEKVRPDLIAVVVLAIGRSTQDFSVLQGARTQEEQNAKYAQGRTTPGEIVTWTLESKHIPDADGFARAVDLAPYPLDWNTPAKFDAIAKAMFSAAKELGVPLRWGADWDRDGVAREKGESDSPHFEIGD